MIEVLKKYPKATEVVRKHYKNLLLQNFKGEMTPEVKEYFEAQKFTDEELGNLISVNPYHLVYVFDENEIYIDTDVHTYVNSIKNDVFFSYKIVGFELSENQFLSRKDAEKEAVIKAFEILNDKL